MTDSTAEPLDGPRVAPKSGGAAKQLVIFLHGVGSDGNDLIQLAPMLAEVLPDAAFVSPHAPYPFDMAPMGRQWFSLRDDRPAAIDQQVADTYGHVDRFLDAEMARAGVAAAQVALVGFSQGGMMALQTALRRIEPLAAVAAMSTILPHAYTLQNEIASRPPVLLVHGDQDNVLPVHGCNESERALKAHNVPVMAHILRGRGHEIDQEGFGLLRDFLVGRLKPA